MSKTKKASKEIRDYVVTRDCGASGHRYLTFGFGSQYTDYMDFAGRTTQARAEQMVAGNPLLRAMKLTYEEA